MDIWGKTQIKTTPVSNENKCHCQLGDEMRPGVTFHSCMGLESEWADGVLSGLRQSKASSRWPRCVTAHHPQFSMAVVKLFLKHMQRSSLQKPAKGGGCFCIVVVEKCEVV